jgi:hypothetical protein
MEIDVISLHRNHFSRVTRSSLVFALVALTTFAAAQNEPPSRRAPGRKSSPRLVSTVTPRNKARTKFVSDVLKMAVALPAGDAQDRLEVLVSAIMVASTVDPKLARSLAQEGAEIETRVIASGQKPAASVMESAKVGCGTAQQFVDALAPTSIGNAEQALLGALDSCPKTLDAVRSKLEAGMAQNVVAPRAWLAAMEASGLKSDWTKEKFEALFSALPKDETQGRAVAPDIATLYARVAAEAGRELAAKAGLRFFEWLNHLPEGSDRNLAVNVTTGAMRELLGPQGYEETLASNVMARQMAQTEGQAAETEREPEESVSVLEAMRDKEDRTAALSELPPSLRAREAAASGFARGNEGDLEAANKYFDVAFSAVDSAWDVRREHTSMAAVVTEVCEAAAYVDPVSALRRAQHLGDSSAQAIGMLAVARVVLTRQQGLQPSKAASASPSD